MQRLTLILSTASIAATGSFAAAGIATSDETLLYSLQGFDAPSEMYRMMPAEFFSDLKQMPVQSSDTEITFSELARELTDGFDDNQIELHADESTSIPLLAHHDPTLIWADPAPSDQDSDRTDERSSVLSSAYVLSSAIRMMSSAVPAPGGAALAFGGMLVLARRKR